MRIRSADEGSVLPLILVFFMVAAGLIVVAAGATGLHLERLRLLSVADGAALAGAESFALDDVTVQNESVVPRLRSSAVHDAVEEYLSAAGTDRFDGFTLVTAGTTDRRDAVVELRATWHPAIAGSLLPISVPVTVVSHARALFR